MAGHVIKIAGIVTIASLLSAHAVAQNSDPPAARRRSSSKNCKINSAKYEIAWGLFH